MPCVDGAGGHRGGQRANSGRRARRARGGHEWRAAHTCTRGPSRRRGRRHGARASPLGRDAPSDHASCAGGATGAAADRRGPRAPVSCHAYPRRSHRDPAARAYTRPNDVLARTTQEAARQTCRAERSREGRRAHRRIRRRGVPVRSPARRRPLARARARDRGRQPQRGPPARPVRPHAAAGRQRGAQDIRDRYVDPRRVKSKDMLLSALDYVQKDVAQVIVVRDETNPSKVRVRVDTQEKEFRVDDVIGPWDVSSHLRDVFAFVQDGLRGTDVDLRDVEYAASNGMLHTLDPHSVLLSPEAYKEMNLSTQGQFGGLGIVISIRDQQLTVMNPMPNTPAGRAGVKKYDRITKINNESTLNMGLNEAVNHLRGPPGTKVNVWIHRDGSDGWSGSRPFELTREVIHVASVEHRLMDGGIGYVRIKQFQANTTSELQSALADLKKNGELRGLVLDLRGNPGGLLDQAAKVVDTFVADGPIVATVGNPSEGREEKSAHGDGTEPNYPLAVLVNGSSASASEIVTGALKNHDRAVIIGETTFGKGSVQLVFTDLPDKAALKLTIAQYLTEPGDVSIQGVGVTPDVELDAMTVDGLEMDLNADSSGIKERDLSRALSNVRAKDGGRPSEVVRYDLPIKDRLEMRERGGDLDDNFELDFPIQFARGFLSHVQTGKRAEQVRQAKPFIADTRKAELDKVAEELKNFGVDWSDAPADAAASSP